MPRLFVGPALQLVYRQAGRIPLLSKVLARDYRGRFAANRAPGLFRGVYGSFAEALRHIPTTQPAGYDHPEAAQMYRERLERIYTNDYPVLLWLERVLASTRRVFDFGGHVGIAYYGFHRYVRYPQGLEWTVCDVPAVVEEGRRLAQQRDASSLSFTSVVEDADGADVFFASGSLQYVETPLAVTLAAMKRRPPHLLLNLLPLHPSRTFVTVQSIGTAFCPYLVQAREPFIAGLAALGYELVDAWDNPDKACIIPFHPTESVLSYSGLYLRATGH